MTFHTDASCGSEVVPRSSGLRLGRMRWLAMLLSLMAVALAVTPGCRSSVETKVVFLRDWDAAKEQATSEGKPIMINFYTDT
jgi:hypothetical protein